MTGIYFLLDKNKKVIYIGQTIDFEKRIKTHHITFHSFRVIQCDKIMLRKYESRWIHKFLPKENRNGKPRRKEKFSLYLDKTVMGKVAKAAEKTERSINYVVEKSLEKEFA